MIPRPVKIFFALFALFVIVFSFGSDLAVKQRGGFFSDESSYFAIMQSLAFDGDLKYDRGDIRRIERDFVVGPIGFFLKKGRDGQIYYAKSYVYPLFAAPFYRLFGVHGILLCNGLMLWLVMLMGFLLLSRLHPPRWSLGHVLLYVLGSVAFCYIWWITADLFNFFVVFTALFFFFYPFRQPRWHLLFALFFACAVFSKPNNVIAAGFLYLILLWRRQWQRFAAAALLFLIVAGGLVAFNYFQTGEVNYQGGERRTFYFHYPYERPTDTFESGHKMSSDDYWQRLHLSPHIAALNLFYYFFGRYTGMFIYFFPAVFLLILFFFGKKSAEDWFLFAAVVASIAFYLVITPENYFGGAGSLGNRYFLSVYPLFFFLGWRARSLRFSLVPVIAAIVFLSPVVMDSFSLSASPRLPGLGLPIRWFPAEKTQYATLPSNINPRAFDRSVGGKYTLYYLTDAYHALEGESFWTVGDQELEMFLLAPAPVREFTLVLKNHPRPNRVHVQIENQRRRIVVSPNDTVRVHIRNVPCLRIGERALYLVSIRSEREFTPFFDAGDSNDRRRLGVQVRLELAY